MQRTIRHEMQEKGNLKLKKASYWKGLVSIKDNTMNEDD